MSFTVVVENGTYGFGSRHFKPGRWTSDDEDLRSAIVADDLEHVYVLPDGYSQPELTPEPPKVAEPEPEPEPEPTPDGDGPTDPSLETGPMTLDDMPKSEYACREGDCDKSFATSRGRVMHERSRHQLNADD